MFQECRWKPEAGCTSFILAFGSRRMFLASFRGFLGVGPLFFTLGGEIAAEAAAGYTSRCSGPVLGSSHRRWLSAAPRAPGVPLVQGAEGVDVTPQLNLRRPRILPSLGNSLKFFPCNVEMQSVPHTLQDHGTEDSNEQGRWLLSSPGSPCRDAVMASTSQHSCESSRRAQASPNRLSFPMLFPSLMPFPPSGAPFLLADGCLHNT